jgi:alpha-L-fucosidase
MRRRAAIKSLIGAFPFLRAAGTLTAAPSIAVSLPQTMAQGPFQPTHESLATYEVPQWFRDAKFGIWAHWGPQSAAEAGDWYARNMYMQGSEQYKHHLEHFGHPSKSGFKEVIATWKADQFDPDYLVGLYKKAGARYFCSMAVHHDNFDLWNSKHTRWNAVRMGPKKNVVGMFRQAAYKHGLRFGVSDHLWISYKWWAVNHMSDKTGPLAGLPYDGVDPANADLYHSYSDPKLITDKLDWNEDGIPDSWKDHWYQRISDLVEQAEPDYLYNDGALPFDGRSLKIAAQLYNQSAARHAGQCEAVYMSKGETDCAQGTCILDHERGVLEEISPKPWQTDTCIGDWHYKRDIQYKSPKFIVDMLVDVVSRNGNLMLNFPLPNSGMLDQQELAILSEITDWMRVNSEAIYATRPWKISGAGPGSQKSAAKETNFNENARKELTAEDVRFTTKNNVLFAFVMGVPEKRALIPLLGRNVRTGAGKIEHVELLGFSGKLEWRQGDSGLAIDLPETKPCKHALVFKVRGIA